MKNKILISTSLLVAASILFTFILMNIVVYFKTIDEMKRSVKDECGYVKNLIDKYGDTYLTKELGEISRSRLTLVDAKGEVLFDSQENLGEQENHLDRPEVKQAIQNGEGSSIRTSETLEQKMFYYAMKTNDGKIIRVCRTTGSVLNRIYSGFTVIGVLLAVFLLLVAFVIDRTAKRIVRPINEWDLNEPLENPAYEELSPLLVRISQQNDQIKAQMKQLKQNQEEYLAITAHMKDGLIVTNREVVLSINQAAQHLFSVSGEECINHDIITVSRNEELRDAFQIALRGETGERMIHIGDRFYQLLANPVRIKDQKVTGTVILILDITERQEAEMLRKEFTANVSHELKTPLMSISGYAEIMKNGIVKAKDIPVFAGRIYSEASRLSELVEDIINLSRLDENSAGLTKENINLLEMIVEIEQCLLMKAAGMGVELRTSGESVVIYGVYQVIYEVIYNLCDNAIKYNKPSGHVKMLVEKKGEYEVIVEIEDSGIGIPEEEQDRIFERFYRVDKSHSRKTGGTGLGLSIVKHGAALHDARITMSSKVGIGTTIKLIFPLK